MLADNVYKPGWVATNPGSADLKHHVPSDNTASWTKSSPCGHIEPSLGETSASGIGCILTGTKAFSCACAVQVPRYHARFNFHPMVSMYSALLHARNTMKNTIDDVDYIINRIVLFLIIQYVINYRHSHSIVNKPFLSLIFNGLFSC